LFSNHIIYVQAVLSTLDDVFNCDIDNIFVDLPLSEMLNTHYGAMLNFAVTLNSALGTNIALTTFSSQSSVNDIASALEEACVNDSTRELLSTDILF
jgi:hypothetical protein